LISQIELRNFKCFISLKLPLGRITLLTGLNAAGKSTAIQSILLIAQTLRAKEGSPELWLNGPLLHLGAPGDVIAQTANNLQLGLATDSVSCLWTFTPVEREDERVLRISEIEVRDTAIRKYDANTALRQLLPREVSEPSVRAMLEEIRQTIFVSSVRQVQTEIFPSPEDPDPIFADVGATGEFAPWWFHHYDDKEVAVARLLPGAGSPSILRGQVNAWLHDLFPGAEANTQSVAGSRLMRLELRTGKTDDWRRPSNTGYGLSYAFPILVAGLCARPGQLLIVDSPEAHLHPRGQSRIGRFLAQVAASGVQVLIETHSDHVLNSLRLSVRDEILSPTDTKVHFFDPKLRVDERATPVISPAIDLKGNLISWPEGFFDQAETDLAKLAGWS
jgi:predicted ATPase